MALSQSWTPENAAESTELPELIHAHRQYLLSCPHCGATFEDDGLQLRCPEDHAPALLGARYPDSRLSLQPEAAGIFRYHRWLPISRQGRHSARSVVYRDDRLGRRLGLRDLWVAFNGYRPEIGATFETGTFKELEAAAVLARLPPNFGGVLTVASAGNTAAAFAQACSRQMVACLLVVPETALSALPFAGSIGQKVKVVALRAPADYTDAIDLAARICRVPGFQAEGGVWNVARRAGLGTVLLSAVETIGRLPDYYFQAIGSGAGAIAVHEAAHRLLVDGQYGARLPQHILSQNLPFAPIHAAWQLRTRQWAAPDANVARRQISDMFAAVLSTRTPPYGVPGGVYDTLLHSAGDMIAVENSEAGAAAEWFEEHEGVDIDPAGAVALASLQKAVRQGRVNPHSTVLLNITGGGRKKRAETAHLGKPLPDLVLSPSDLVSPALMDRMQKLFA